MHCVQRHHFSVEKPVAFKQQYHLFCRTEKYTCFKEENSVRQIYLLRCSSSFSILPFVKQNGDPNSAKHFIIHWSSTRIKILHSIRASVVNDFCTTEKKAGLNSYFSDSGKYLNLVRQKSSHAEQDLTWTALLLAWNQSDNLYIRLQLILRPQRNTSSFIKFMYSNERLVAQRLSFTRWTTQPRSSSDTSMSSSHLAEVQQTSVDRTITGRDAINHLLKAEHSARWEAASSLQPQDYTITNNERRQNLLISACHPTAFSQLGRSEEWHLTDRGSLLLSFSCSQSRSQYMTFTECSEEAYEFWGASEAIFHLTRGNMWFDPAHLRELHGTVSWYKMISLGMKPAPGLQQSCPSPYSCILSQPWAELL